MVAVCPGVTALIPEPGHDVPCRGLVQRPVRTREAAPHQAAADALAYCVRVANHEQELRIRELPRS